MFSKVFYTQGKVSNPMQLFAQMELKPSFNKVGQELISHSQPPVPLNSTLCCGEIFTALPGWKTALTRQKVPGLRIQGANREWEARAVFPSAELLCFRFIFDPGNSTLARFQQVNFCFFESFFPGKKPYFVMFNFGCLVLLPERIQGKIINEHQI